MLIRAAVTAIARQVQSQILNPKRSQERALRGLVRRVGNSEIGRRQGLDRVCGLEDATKLPVMTYSTAEDVFHKTLLQGRATFSAWGSSRLVAIAQTSGTTRDPKNIPLNRDYFRAWYRSVRRMSALYIWRSRDWAWAYRGQTLTLFARPHTSDSPGGLPLGFISGMINKNSPFWMKGRVTPHAGILGIANWREKNERTLEVALGKDIRMMSGIPSLMLYFGEKALEKTGKRCLQELWPRLGGVIYSGAPITGADRARFNRLISGTAESALTYWGVYSATEGVFGYSFDLENDSLIFDPKDVFFQFEEQEGELPRQLHELEAGHCYSVLVTTPGGLINYRLGDWVEIIATNPVRYRVTGRGQEAISLANEKIFPDQLSIAVQQASAALGIHIANYAMWLEKGDPTRLVWALGMDAVPAGAREALDQALGQVNPVYGEYHQNRILYGDCEVLHVSPSLFADYLARNVDRGQFKPKRLFQDREAFIKEYGNGC